MNEGTGADYDVFVTQDNSVNAKDLVNLEDRCKAALDEINELNSAIKQEFSGLGGIVNVAVNSLNGGK